MKRVVFLLAPALAAAACAPAPKSAIQFPAERIEYRSAAKLPPGTQLAVLEGDPDQAGLFTIRLKAPAGTRLPPHWHPSDERVTVLSGLVMVGFGDVMDETSGARFPAGSYYVNPALSHHYVWFPRDSIVQVTAMGPWELHFVRDAAPKP